MALPFDQIEALAHKLAVADIGADEDEQVTPNAKAVVGELEQDRFGHSGGNRRRDR